MTKDEQIRRRHVEEWTRAERDRAAALNAWCAREMERAAQRHEPRIDRWQAAERFYAAGIRRRRRWLLRTRSWIARRLERLACWIDS